MMKLTTTTKPLSYISSGNWTSIYITAYKRKLLSLSNMAAELFTNQIIQRLQASNLRQKKTISWQFVKTLALEVSYRYDISPKHSCWTLCFYDSYINSKVSMWHIWYPWNRLVVVYNLAWQQGKIVLKWSVENVYLIKHEIFPRLALSWSQ